MVVFRPWVPPASMCFLLPRYFSAIPVVGAYRIPSYIWMVIDEEEQSAWFLLAPHHHTHTVYFYIYIYIHMFFVGFCLNSLPVPCLNSSRGFTNGLAKILTMYSSTPM